MKWNRETDYNLISACKNYRIAKTYGPPGTLYLAYAVGSMPALIVTASLDEAKAACEAHKSPA